MKNNIIRKILTTALLLAFCLLTLCSCSETKEYVTDMKNHFTDANIDAMIVKIQVVDNDASLQGEYTITKQNEGFKVDYTYQKQNTFTMQNGEFVAPNEEISLMSGTATVVEGVVTEHSGAPLNIQFTRLNLSAFNFDTANFGEIECEYKSEGFSRYSNTYRGKITNPKDFAGFDTTKMTFTAVCGSGIDHNTFTMSYEDANNVSVIITYSV